MTDVVTEEACEFCGRVTATSDVTYYSKHRVCADCKIDIDGWIAQDPHYLGSDDDTAAGEPKAIFEIRDEEGS